jgi:hypothetical protein
MNKYLKYSVLNNSSDNQQFELPQIQIKSEIKDITEQSTPKEMANFITTKLVEFIEQELKIKKEPTPQTEKTPV